MRWYVVGVACPQFYVPFPSNNTVFASRFVWHATCNSCNIITKEQIRWFSKQCNRYNQQYIICVCYEMIRTTYVFYGVLSSFHVQPKTLLLHKVENFPQPQKVPSKTRNHLCFALFVPVNYLMGGDLKVGKSFRRLANVSRYSKKIN